MSNAQELEKLHELLVKGAITQAEFEQAKARLFGASAASAAGLRDVAVNRFRRSTTEKWFGGICGGLEVATGVKAWVWRFIFVITAFSAFGFILYVLLWILVPPAERL
jgi:phage shock protein PspC (stress-responsive transcriptional regulator)